LCAVRKGSLIQADYFDNIRKLSKPEHWLSLSGLAVVVFLALSLGITTANLIEFEDKDSITWIRLLYIVSLVLILAVVWLLATQYYLRSGKRIKIGFVARLSPRLREQWAESRKVLTDLSHEGQLNEFVSIRLVPPDSVRSESKLKRFVDRYKFSLVIEIHDPVNTKDGFLSFTVLNKDAIEDGWTLPTISHIQHVFDHRKAAVTPNRIANFVARSIEESVLWLATARLVAGGDYKIAAPLILELEGRVKNDFSEDERPRAQIRWLYKACFVTQAQFSVVDGIPSPEKLSGIENDLDHIVKFDPDDPGLHLQSARIKFFVGKVDEAVACIERAKSMRMNPPQATVASVSSGFLNLIASNFDQAAKDFRSLIDELAEARFSMDDIVAFADYCHEMQYPHTEYIRDLYRVMAGKPVPKDVAAAAAEWLEQDNSRNGLSDVRKYAESKVVGMNQKQPKRRSKTKGAVRGQSRKIRKGRKRKSR